MKSASALYRLLGDDARLRLLRLLSRERLNVSELTAVLGLAVSLAVGVLAALIPAWQAARVQIATALRKVG